VAQYTDHSPQFAAHIVLVQGLFITARGKKLKADH